MSRPTTISELALTGFGLARRRLDVLVVLTLINLLMFAGFAYGLTQVLGADLIKLLQPPDPTTTMTPPEVLAVASRIWIVEAACIGVAMPVAAMTTCQVYRAVLRPNERAFASLRLGVDELRMLVLLLILGLIFGGATIVLIGVIAGAAVALSQVSAWAPFVAAGLGVLLAFPLALWLLVRLCLAGPATFAERRLTLGWKLTQGRVRKLFGLAFMVVVIGMAISMAASLCLNPMLQSLMLQVVTTGDVGAALRREGPLLAALGLVASLLYALYGMVLRAPFAAAYERIVEPVATESEH